MSIQWSADDDRVAAELLAALDAAASARDVEAFCALFADSVQTLLAIEGEVIGGLARIRDAHSRWWSGLRKAVFRTTVRCAIRLGDRSLLVTAEGESRRTWAHDGSSVQQRYAMTLLLVLEPAGWRVLQLHESLAPAHEEQ